MRSKNLILVFLLCLITNVLLSQNSLKNTGAIETVGAGVIDFLLSNPKTASKFNATEEAALSTVGSVLQIFGERKHQVNVATAGKDQIIINSNDGSQVTAVMDNQGKMYLQKDGVIYPVASSLVNQAKEYVLNQQPGYMNYVKGGSFDNSLMLPDYNSSQLENVWHKKVNYEINSITISEGEYASQLLGDLNVGLEDLYYENKGKYLPILQGQENKHLNKFISNEQKAFPIKNKRKDQIGFAAVIGSWSVEYLFVRIIKPQPRGTFTSRWVKDVNGNGDFEFDEFQDIRRNFFENESFVIAAGLYSQDIYRIKLDIYEQLTGNIVYTDEIDNAKERINMGYFNFLDDSFKPGIYVYYISFVNSKTNTELEKLSENFQILSVEQVKEREKGTNPPANIPQKENSSKEKMMNDLIQLLKDGKISEETFKVSMKALENK